MSLDDVSTLFLEDGRQKAESVAGELCRFLEAAQHSLDIAVYDCGLTEGLADTVGGALRDAAHRGVAVRLAYWAGPHGGPLVRPPTGSSGAFVQGVGVPSRAISSFRDLMHDKYVVRDAGADGAAVWTGSTNWTADAWQREENIILQIPSAALARFYRADFDDLWQRGAVEGTGGGAGGIATVQFAGKPAQAQVWFSPACGVDMAHAVADEVRAARSRIVLASPVLSDGSILGALRDVVSEGKVPIRGVYDATQMEEALMQWRQDPRGSWKPEAFEQVREAGHLAGKRSTPYSPRSVHDYMHVKLVVVDDSVFTGSYNFSHSGEENAENLLRIDSPDLADACASYVDGLISRYGASPATT